ncbi:sensor histidine kinase [Fulvivirga kasyanovii]|nr:HAMP domain-containing sensor histidine kinase [Fulvivirga kasyanovii]
MVDKKHYKRSLLISCIQLIMLCMVLACTTLNTVAQQMFVRSFPQSGQNLQVKQDRQGIIYVTNTNGLLTYDGSNWSLMPMPNNSYPISLAIDNADNIYIGANEDLGYFLKDSTGNYTYSSLVPKLSEKYRQVGNVHTTIIHDGSVFFCDEKHVYVYTKGNFKVLDFESYASWSMFVAGNHLFFLNLDYELLEYTKKGLIKIDLKKDFRIWDMEDYIEDKSLALDNQGRIWLFNASDFNEEWHLITGNYLDLPEGTKIQQIKYTKNNQIALFTVNGIIFINEQGKIVSRVYEVPYEDACLDASHNLWVTTPSDVLMISTSSPLNYYDERDGLNDYILCLAKAGDYEYVGTEKGLYYRKGRSGFSLLPQTARPIEGVWNLYCKKTQIYAAHNDGVFEVTGDKVTKITDHMYVMSLCGVRQDSNALIMGTYNSGIWLLKKKHDGWKKNKIKGFDEHTRYMQTDSEGNIWISHDTKGIWKLRLNAKMDTVISREFYDMKRGLPSNINNRIFCLNNNRLVATTTNGVYRYHNETDRFEPEIRINEALGENVVVYSISETPEGNLLLWAMRAAGEATAYYLKKQTNENYSLIEAPFKKITQSIPPTSIDVDTRILHVSPEEIWISHKESLIAYNPRQQTFYDDTVRTHIKYAWTKDSLIHSNWQTKREHIIPYSKNTLHFQFTSTFYESAEKLKYQYILSGFDDNWSAWNNTGEAVFTNLREGDYTFLVRAKNVYDKVGDPAYFKFHIQPPWYRTTWAYLTYISLSILLVYWIIHIKTKNVERQKLLLQKEVNKKTRELLTMNEEITAINEDIYLKNQEISKQADELKELNFTKDKIFSVISHDLRGSVKQIPELLNLFDSGYISAEEFRSLIPNLKEASRNLSSLTDNLLHWAKCQMNGIEVKKSNFNLIEVVDETLRLLNAHAEKKGLQLVNDTDKELPVCADKDMIRLLLRNLISNAIKFTPKNGVITIRSERKEDSIHVSVTDTGVGLTTDEIDKILGREFFTKYGTAGEKGSGLGLMLCKEFAELHGGNLFIKGVPGQGSEFSFTIPYSL